MNKVTGEQQLKIIQNTDWLEIIPCLEVMNEYQIMKTNEDYTEDGEQVALVDENNPGFLCLFCCKACRKYESNLKVDDNTVAQSKRPWKCAIPNTCNICTFFEQCQQELDVFQGEEKIGSVRWPYACFLNKNRGWVSCCELDITDASGEIIYKITADCKQLPFIVQCFCGVSCGCIDSLSKKEYTIQDATGSPVGSITNIYNDLLLECCTRADKFGVKFPASANDKQKLLLLKAAIFLDFIQYAA